MDRFQAHLARGLHLPIFELFFHGEPDQMGSKHTVRVKAF